MVRIDALRAIYPDMKIYESRQGQNWQILIPMAGAHPCGYIDEPLYLYMVRDSSHSHQKRTLEERLERYDGLEDILLRSVAIAGRSDRDYQRIIYIKRLKSYLHIHLEDGDYKGAAIYYHKLRQEKALEHHNITMYLSACCPVKYRLYQVQFWNRRALNKIIRICFGK